MPNWAITSVYFWGYERDVEQIHEAFREGTPFSILRPIPEDADPYDWAIANWGTKWDASDIQIVSELRSVLGNPGLKHFAVRFDTAWSPPEELLVYLANQYPELEISGDYTLEEESHEVSYDFIARADRGFVITGSESLFSDDEEEEEAIGWSERRPGWDDPPDDCPDDPSFRAVTGSATKLPLP